MGSIADSPSGTGQPSADSVWLFGYGSLLWKTEFPYQRREQAFITGWARRFWQGSADHRGTPERPGRVVTLVPVPDGGPCWGAAFEIPAADRERVFRQLDIREQGGYERIEVGLHLDGGTIPGICYIATQDNPNFLGPDSLDNICRQIRSASGPSGKNLDYVLELQRALAKLGGAADQHVEEIYRRLVAPSQSA